MKQTFLFIIVLLTARASLAQTKDLSTNPIITDCYTADPSARVFGDTLYVYPSHDRAEAQTFDMEDYHVYSTTDMIHFRDEGLCFDALRATSWAEQNAWAPDCVERNGKYYLYYPTDKRYIGVAVSDSPKGPFRDALGVPLISIDTPGVVCNRDFIDPCVYIDDDGQAYLFVGQNTLCCIKLNPDMVSYDHSGGRIVDGKETGVYVIEGVNEFFEAIWVHKRDGKYYLSYSDGTQNGHQPRIAYATSENPLGPYTYQGVILPPQSSGTNHHSIVEYRGQWYIFYHNSDLSMLKYPNEKKAPFFRRSVCVDRLFYDSNGAILPVIPRPCDMERMRNATPK